MFSTDRQTMDDLILFWRHGSNNSIMGLFNRCVTRGGAALLEEMFRYPLNDPGAINDKSQAIEYFAKEGLTFPFQSDLFDAIEPYLANTDERTRLSPRQLNVKDRLNSLIAVDTETAMILRGVTSLIELLATVKKFIQTDGLAVVPEMLDMIKEITLLMHQ